MKLLKQEEHITIACSGQLKASRFFAGAKIAPLLVAR
jgi:hypothetical protein